jgi:hypothetical protein
MLAPPALVVPPLPSSLLFAEHAVTKQIESVIALAAILIAIMSSSDRVIGAFAMSVPSCLRSHFFRQKP